MKIVIQCAAKKQPDAGYFTTKHGNEVLFVAKPNSAPPRNGVTHAHPDSFDDDGVSWRDRLIEINEKPDVNGRKLLPAWKLYKNPAYGKLVQAFGHDNIFVLSAGWGLVPANYLLPDYDITFSQSAEKYKRRGKKDNYKDFRGLMQDDPEPVIYLGGKDYINLFSDLTAGAEGKRIIVYNSSSVPTVPGCDTIKYETTTRTNWHYQCANDIIAGCFLSDISDFG